MKMIDSSELIGRQIGKIRVIGMLGMGGMGSVYLGVDERLQRQVAVKAIHRRHRLNPETKARFQREARILSQLNHPRICVVHDLIEDDDTDFLVLELVNGRSLRKVMDEDLDHAAALSVAMQLLDVLVAVHGKGVIHRDLKPENVMITAEGEIKVLDFGLARSAEEEEVIRSGAVTLVTDTEEDGQGETSAERRTVYLRTRLGTVMGTVGYMSPEQARGEPATPASDIYALGLIMQEMLTGRPPVQRDLPVRQQLLRAAEGTTEPVRDLDPELTDLINRLKSLAPGARPSSMDAREQLRHVIDGPRRRRRRRLGAAVWAALLLLTVCTTVQSVRASRAARRAEAEEMRAREEAETANRIAQFLENLFQVSDPREAPKGSVTLREVLDRGAAKIERQLADQPLLRARLQLTIGRVYGNLGLFDQAGPMLEQSLAIQRQASGEHSLAVADSLVALGYVTWRKGEFIAARDHYERALAIYQEAGEDDERVATCLDFIGNTYKRLGEYGQALQYCKRALEIWEKTQGPSSVQVAEGLNSIGSTLVFMDRDQEAVAVLERAAAIWPDDSDDPRSAFPVFTLAQAMVDLERYRDAEVLCRQALAVWQAAYGEDHNLVAYPYMCFGDIRRGQGRLAEAQQEYQRSIEIWQRMTGEDHPDMAWPLFGLAEVHRLQRRVHEAVALYQRSIDIYGGEIGTEEPLLALAEVYRDLGKNRQAIALYRRVGSEFHRVAKRRIFVGALKGLAAVLRAEGRQAEAQRVDDHRRWVAAIDGPPWPPVPDE